MGEPFAFDADIPYKKRPYGPLFATACWQAMASGGLGDWKEKGEELLYSMMISRIIGSTAVDKNMQGNPSNWFRDLSHSTGGARVVCGEAERRSQRLLLR